MRAGGGKLRIVVFHGPDNAAKHELLAWLRGPVVAADAVTVGENTPDSSSTVDERVTETLQWADKAIALATFDPRTSSAALNVVDEIGRWRATRAKDLGILRSEDCPIWTNLAGVVRLDYKNRVSERFLDLMSFLGILPGRDERLLGVDKSQEKELKQDCRDLAKEILEFVDERRRSAPMRYPRARYEDYGGPMFEHQEETARSYVRRFAERVWLMAKRLEMAGHADAALSAHLTKWEPGEFEAAGELSDIEDLGSRLLVVAGDPKW